jgi:thiol-disulfide isomerase/thioredoxin
MSKVWLGVVVALLVIGTICHAQESPVQVARSRMLEAVEGGDAQAARVQAHEIMTLLEGKELDSLSADDLYSLGLAHHQIAGEMLDRAMQTGQLTEEQRDHAQRVLTSMTPTPTAAGAVEEVRVIGHGEQVNLDDYLVAGKTTIVDFSSEYCGPCRALAPRLEELANRRDDIVVVKVDINRPGQVGIDWQSPVARQFQLRSIPHVRIYGPDKQLQAEGRPALGQVIEWCEAQ